MKPVFSFGAATTDRRGLLRSAVGDWAERLVEQAERRVAPIPYVRPPGALPEVVLVPPDGGLAAGTPRLLLDREPCIGCPTMPCAVVCPTPALTVPSEGWAGYRLAELEFHPERCLTYRGASCRVCADSCPQGAAALVIDDTGHPAVRQEGCIGCGVCVRSCVTRPSSFTLHHAET
jgi:NAD-dependent dihydropyrimidine dehydrogenase PreA subunit